VLTVTKQKEETRAVWAAIKGSEELFEIYGYYPTLHDAYVVAIDVRFETKQLKAVIEYSDSVGSTVSEKGQKQSKAVKIVMGWNEVSQADINVHNNDIYDLSFLKANELIRTELRSGWGIAGSISAKTVEVLSVQNSDRTHLDQDAYLHTINFKLSG
jgi:hypothetical protein